MLSAAVFADGARGHWAIENNLHWTLDVTFNEDQSRLRAGHGAKNMAVVRHFALNLVRQVVDKRSIKPPKARRLLFSMCSFSPPRSAGPNRRTAAQIK
jgi:hypothetical protein